MPALPSYEHLLHRYRFDGSRQARLAQIDRDEPGSADLKAPAKQRRRENVQVMAALQFRLYAESRRRLLVVLQAMDTGGKDGTIRRVFSGVNPQGCNVTSFGVPSEAERDHGFLWRIHRAIPRRGNIGIFNRSHYEDVGIVRVHGEIDEATCARRYEQINRFERLIADADTTILKLFLHISRDEQTRRLQKRIDDPERRWKLSDADLAERARWDDYQRAYEDAINACAAPHAPWFVIPANRKWYRNLVVSELVRGTLEAMDPRFPEGRLKWDGLTLA